MFLRFLLLTSLLIGSVVVQAQSGEGYDGFLGSWTGIITQVDGATVTYFDMEMTVSAQIGSDSSYSVSTRVMDGNYNAYLVGEGFKSGKERLFIAESEIIRADSIPGMEWCVKRYELRKKMKNGELHLQGVWGGDTSFGACLPGDMDLVRQVIRP
ncbi:MAG: hypothetical protein AB8F78_00700 [Saprospiraceae bacterium]